MKTIKQLSGLIIFCIILSTLGIGLDLYKNYDINQKYVTFKNDGILVCYNTLIVTNSNWKLVEDNLINDNSAGYIDIKKCIIKN